MKASNIFIMTGIRQHQFSEFCRLSRTAKKHFSGSHNKILRLRSEGYKTIEISQMLGIKHSTIRTRLSRMRVTLKELGAA